MSRSPLRDRRSGAWIVSDASQMRRLANEGDLRREICRRVATDAVGDGPLGTLANESVLMSDPPLHEQLRRTALRALAGADAPASMDRVREHVAAELGASDDRVDIARLARDAAAVGLGEALSLDPETAVRASRCSRVLLAVLDPIEVPVSMVDEARAAAEALFSLIREMDVDRHPVIASYQRLLAEVGLADVVDPVGQLATLMVAGHETTATSAMWALRELALNATLAAAVHADRDARSELVERSLRDSAPVPYMIYRTSRAVTVGGVEIPAGADVVFHYAAANRRLATGDGDGARHLTFGVGAHACIGAAYARAVVGGAASAFAAWAASSAVTVSAETPTASRGHVRSWEQLVVTCDSSPRFTQG